MKFLALNCSSAGDVRLDKAFDLMIEKLGPTAEINKFTIRDLDIKPCYSCTAQYSYKYDDKCRCDDDMNKMYPFFKESDTWFFALKVEDIESLTYLRNLLDRMEPLFQPIYFLDNGMDFSSAPDIKLKGKIAGLVFCETEYKETAEKIAEHLESVSILFDKKFSSVELIDSNADDTYISERIDDMLNKLSEEITAL